MRRSHPRGRLLRPALVLALAGLLTLALVTPTGATSSPAAVVARVRPTITLDSVGSRYVGALIPVSGRTAGVGVGKHTIALQRYAAARHRWVTRMTERVRRGPYSFPSQRRSSPGWVRLRTVLYVGGRRVAVSNVVAVQVVGVPAPSTSSAPPPPAGPATCAGSPSVDLCIHPVAQQPQGAVLPDLQIKNLTKCGKGDLDATGGTCFLITHRLSDGHKLLKFGVITFNVGLGPAELAGHRSSSLSTDWTAYQNFYDASGNLLGSVLDPGVQFTYAGDQHSHWHVIDFDTYDLLDANGHTVAHAEKHGYCMQDNTTYTPMQGFAGVPLQEVYAESTSCGKLQPAAVTIVHGLSRGWGDTYPTTLPDQAIDITGLADGVYTVLVHADGKGVVAESDETNNDAEARVQISGDTVTVLGSTGGLS